MATYGKRKKKSFFSTFSVFQDDSDNLTIPCKKSTAQSRLAVTPAKRMPAYGATTPVDDNSSARALIEDSPGSQDTVNDFGGVDNTGSAAETSLMKFPTFHRNKPLPPIPPASSVARKVKNNPVKIPLLEKSRNMKLRMNGGHDASTKLTISAPILHTQVDPVDPKLTALPRAPSGFNLMRYVRPNAGKQRVPRHDGIDTSPTKDSGLLHRVSHRGARMFKQDSSQSDAPRSKHVLDKVKDAITDHFSDSGCRPQYGNRRHTVVGTDGSDLTQLLGESESKRNSRALAVQKNLYSPKIRRIMDSPVQDLPIFETMSNRSSMVEGQFGTDVSMDDLRRFGESDDDVFVDADTTVPPTPYDHADLVLNVPKQLPPNRASNNIPQSRLTPSEELEVAFGIHQDIKFRQPSKPANLGPITINGKWHPSAQEIADPDDFKDPIRGTRFSNQRNPLRQHPNVTSFISEPISPPDDESTPRKVHARPSRRDGIGLAISPLRRTHGYSTDSLQTVNDRHWDFVPGNATLLDGTPYQDLDDTLRGLYSDGSRLTRPFNIPELTLKRASDGSTASTIKRNSTDADLLCFSADEQPPKKARPTPSKEHSARQPPRSPIPTGSPTTRFSFAGTDSPILRSSTRHHNALDDDRVMTPLDPESTHLADDDEEEPLISTARAVWQPPRAQRRHSMVPGSITVSSGRRGARREVAFDHNNNTLPSISRINILSRSPLQNLETSLLNGLEERRGLLALTKEASDVSGTSTDELQRDDEGFRVGFAR